MMIPVIKINEFKKTKSTDSKGNRVLNIFYGFDNEKEKSKHLKALKKLIPKHSECNIYYDFKNNTKIGHYEWSVDGDIMVYENRNATDSNRLILGGKGEYECVLWISCKI